MNLKKWIPALLLVAGATQALSPVETYGTLAVDKSKLVDSKGSPVTLRGMSLFWHVHMGGKEFWNAEAMSWAMTDWHASVIRAPIGVDDVKIGTGDKLPGAISAPANADEYIHRVVNAAIELGLYIIVDWHAEGLPENGGWRGGDPTFRNAAIKFFGGLAKEYGNTPNIIWELYNEPYSGTAWSSIADYAKAVIPEIRKYNNGIILVGNSDWDQKPDQADAQLDGYSNIAYTVHFYNTHSHQGTVGAAMSKGHAVFASEWGMSGPSGDNDFVTIQSGSGTIASWMKTLDDAGVSSCNWSLGNPRGSNGTGSTREASAALKVGVSPSGGWSADDLTASGTSIRTYLRSKNPAWTLPDTATKVMVPLKILSPKTTDFVLKQDTIEFSASYNKAVKWSMVETGRTSKATKLSEPSSPSSRVSVRHAAGARDTRSGSFQAGETVDVLVQPLAQKLTYTISTSSSVLHRVHEASIGWQGNKLVLPNDLIPQGSRVNVMLRDASGKVSWQTSATMGAFGIIELSQARPLSSGVQILDVVSAGAYVRSRLAPNF